MRKNQFKTSSLLLTCFIALSLAIGFQNRVDGQTGGNRTTVPDTRAQPAPWRPAFAPLGAAPTGSQGTELLARQPLNQGVNQTPANQTPAVGQGGWQSGVPFNSEQNNSTQQSNGQQPDLSRLPAAVTPTAGNRVAGNNVRGNAPVSGTVANENTGNNSFRTASTNTNGPSFDGVRTRNMLPNSAGQVWREYDISPYTSQIKTDDEPQQAIVEWILRETGTEMWFNRPLGILNAERERLYVYHTPEIHNVIRPIVERFVRSRGQMQNVDVTLCTVENPNWRTRVATIMQPIEVQSAAVEAWLVSKENAALLMGQLSRRGDFKQHSSGRVTIAEGQHISLEKTQPVQFIRNLRWTPGIHPGYQPMMTQIDSGYRLSISPLLTSDGNNIEATIKCDVDQVEKLTPVNIEVPAAPGAPGQQMTVNIPQIVSWQLHDRFRWPNDQVLVLSCGVVARPTRTFRPEIARLCSLSDPNELMHCCSLNTADRTPARAPGQPALDPFEDKKRDGSRFKPYLGRSNQPARTPSAAQNTSTNSRVFVELTRVSSAHIRRLDNSNATTL